VQIARRILEGKVSKKSRFERPMDINLQPRSPPMPVDPNAAIEISAFSWVPDFARGLVRDLRIRWALEEAGLSYRERLYDGSSPRPDAYLQEQPFGQVPSYRDREVNMFETGAIVLHIAEKADVLMPRDVQGRTRATSWVLAALNTIEPFVTMLVILRYFTDAESAKAVRPQVEKFAGMRLGQLSAWLGDRDWLEDRFTVGDLVMAHVLEAMRHTDLLAEYPNLVAYKARCQSRPSYQAALAAQLASYKLAPAPA
jgi:glutathione S-transferase